VTARREHFAMVRAAEALLLLLMLIGALALWTVVPAATLIGVGLIVDKQAEHLISGLMAVPIAMIAFGLCLAWLNTLYLRVAARIPSADEDKLGWRPRLGGPLDPILTVSAVIAMLGFVLWLVLGSDGTLPGVT
jgi:hypothetical protein